MRWVPEPAAFRALLGAMVQEIRPVYVVGGVVRDLLMRRTPRGADLDLAVAHSAIPVARRVADRLGWAFYALDEARDVARLLFTAGGEPLVCDIARLRGGSIGADLLARDFTVNALAFELRPDGEAGGFGSTVEVIDPGSGRADLAAGLIRRVNAASLADDPVRLLRAVRFSVELGFPIEEETRLQILRMPRAVELAAPERVRDELWKMLAGHDPATVLDLLRALGLLPFVLPEVAGTDLVAQSAPHDKDVFRHTLAAVQGAAALRDWLLRRRARVRLPEQTTELLLAALQALEPWAYYLRQHFAPPVAAGRTRAEWLVWMALFHDVGKADTATPEPQPDGGVRIRFLGHEEAGARKTEARLEALRFSRPEIDLCTAAVRSHMRPHHLHDAFPGTTISRRARFRFFRDVGMKTVDRPVGVDVLLLALADALAINEQRTLEAWRAYLHHVAEMFAFLYSEKGIETPSLRPLVDGRTVMQELELLPGPQVGAILEEIAEAQAAGEVATAADALALARRLVADGKME